MIPWSTALPQPDPVPAPEPSDPPEPAIDDDTAPAAPAAAGELSSEIVAPVRPAKVASLRRARWDRYRPRPAVTLLAFAAGIAIGAGIFVSRIQPPAGPEGLPASPYLSLDGSQAAPFPVIMVMEGLTSNAARMPTVVDDRALGQLKSAVDDFSVITSIEHQGTVVVADQSVSALIVHGIDRQGRSAASTLTAYLVNGQIVEFR